MRTPKQEAARKAAIRSLNDLARKAMGVASVVVQTAGIQALDPAVQSRIRERVETYRAWTSDNDPWGEHDCGAFAEGDIRVFWKIDYYDRALEYHSPDPANPAVTKRVLTIMRSDEY
jgi:hypothetical protein